VTDVTELPKEPRGTREVDRLGNCIEVLRMLAKSREPTRAIFIERDIDEYFRTEKASLRIAIERINEAIEEEIAKKRVDEDGRF
jgi:hypothetical protein